MILTLLLLFYFGERVSIRVFEPRWINIDGQLTWRGAPHGNRRREQVVTLQSNVYSMLDAELQQAIFVEGGYSEMWPLGPDSPELPPRNIPIRLLEDRLLAQLQERRSVRLIAAGYELDRRERPDILAICDGARSGTRERLVQHFGKPHPEMYTLNGNKLREVVLGMQIQGNVPDGEGVLLTVSQNRYLLNTFQGKGFLNMRLTADEAAELVGIGASGPVRCLQGRPCVMARQGSAFACPTHGTVFKPSIDSSSFLWPRMLEGLRLFGMDQENLVAVTSFEFALEHRPRFTAEVMQGTWGCLLGDAALAIHFWPGRGLNTSIKSATSLARCLARRWNGRHLREADLVEHEGVMHMLQTREIGNRAWRIMQMNDATGAACPIEQRIHTGLEGEANRKELAQCMLERMRSIRARLAGRMGELPTDARLEGRLAGLSARTLKVLVETGPWITDEVGGPEVNVAELLPLPTTRE